MTPVCFVGVTAEDWSAVGQVLLAFAAIVGGFWAVYNYHRTRRTEAARWLQGVFKDFYLSDTFKDVRLLLEYNYPERAAPLLERRITDRHVPPTLQEIDILQDLDTLLNYFEHVLYLEDEGRMSRDDRQAVFEYWISIMLEPERASIRLYTNRFGFERVARVLYESQRDYVPKQPECVAVYGTLMKGFGLPDAPEGLDDLLIDRGSCILQGNLFDLGEYPGLMPGEGHVVGALYEVRDNTAFTLLDDYERYDARDRARSLYIRKSVRLVEPERDAWAYFYNGSVRGKPLIASGNWAEYKSARERTRARRRATRARSRLSHRWMQQVRARLDAVHFGDRS